MPALHLTRHLFFGAFAVSSRLPCLIGGQLHDPGSIVKLFRVLFHCSHWRNMQHATPQKRSKITISIDGNISSGKSTLVARLKELFPRSFNFQVELVPEPLEKWTDCRGQNLLGMFYDDPVKNNFVFQHYVQLTRLMETIKPSPEIDYKEGCKGTVRIMERSLQNNRYCFIELARRDGRLTEAEFAVLSEWHMWMEEKFDLNLDLIIYLRTNPETVYNRMQQRGRQEESSVPLEYLKNLNETYEDWLIRGKIGPPPAITHLASESFANSNIKVNVASNNNKSNQVVVVLDANQGKEEVARDCNNFLNNFMKQFVSEKIDIRSI